jgi:deoxycytidylate deaminase
MVGNKLIPSHKQKIAHSEYRTLRKLNKWATAMFVVRISKEAHARGNIEYKMARPCENCSSAIVAKEIGRVYYTISDSQYGLFIPGNDSDSIFEF